MADTRYLGPPIPAPGPGRTRRPRHVGAHGPDQVRPPRTPGPIRPPLHPPAHMPAPNANAVAHASEHASEHARFNRPPTPINPTPAHGIEHGIEHDAHTEMAGMASAAHGQSMRPGRMAPDPAAVMSPVDKNHARLGIFKGEGGY